MDARFVRGDDRTRPDANAPNPAHEHDAVTRKPNARSSNNSLRVYPGTGIPGSQAVCRFVNNDRVTSRKVVEPHAERLYFEQKLSV